MLGDLSEEHSRSVHWELNSFWHAKWCWCEFGPQWTETGCSSFQFKHYLWACTNSSGKKLLIMQNNQWEIIGDQPHEIPIDFKNNSIIIHKTDAQDPRYLLCSSLCRQTYHRMTPDIGIWTIGLREVHTRAPRAAAYVNFLCKICELPRNVGTAGCIPYHHHNLTWFVQMMCITYQHITNNFTRTSLMSLSL